MEPKTKIIKQLLRAMSFLFTLIVSHNVMATNVSGTIVNQTWTSNNSPYIVVGNINVAGLTIKPGVTVSFATNYAFEVDGVLRALGTPNAPIVFKGTNGGWQGIYFNYSSPGSVLAYCTISNAVYSGISIINSNPQILNCFVTSNSSGSSTSGGGIYVNNAKSSGVVQLLNCLIIGNSAVQYGGGIYAWMGTNCLLDIEGCLISNNIVNPSVVTETCYGGGVFVSGNSLLKYCNIRNNICHGVSAFSNDQWAYGGGIFSQIGSETLQNCVIISNTVVTTGGGVSYAYGGGIELTGSGTLWTTNSVIGGNIASASGSYGAVINGGGISIAPGTAGAFVNCSFAYNNPEGLNSAVTNFQVMNTILYFNNNNGTQIVGTTNVTYCDVQGGLTGVGNINLNPIFYGTDNLIIVSGSPCINAGNTNAIYNNVYFPPSLGKKHNDIGAHGGPGAGPIMNIQTWPQAEVRCYGGVPGYNYEIDASTDLVNWQAAQQYQIAHLGDYMDYLETNTLPYRFYKLNLAP
jgi:hypothetical protein